MKITDKVDSVSRFVVSHFGVSLEEALEQGQTVEKIREIIKTHEKEGRWPLTEFELYIREYWGCTPEEFEKTGYSLELEKKACERDIKLGRWPLTELDY